MAIVTRSAERVSLRNYIALFSAPWRALLGSPPPSDLDDRSPYGQVGSLPPSWSTAGPLIDTPPSSTSPYSDQRRSAGGRLERTRGRFPTGLRGSSAGRGTFGHWQEKLAADPTAEACMSFDEGVRDHERLQGTASGKWWPLFCANGRPGPNSECHDPTRQPIEHAPEQDDRSAGAGTAGSSAPPPSRGPTTPASRSRRRAGGGGERL